MHLLSAQPGGFVENEGIVDLNQTPADLIILSAADSSLAAISAALPSLPHDFPSLRLANWLQLIKPAAYDLYQDSVIKHAKVVIVSLLGGRSYWEYGVEQLQQWSKTSGRILIVIPGDDSPDPLVFSISNVEIKIAQQVWRYLREGGVNNCQQLLAFVAHRFCNKNYRWKMPQPLPRASIYLPDNASATLVNCQSQWQQKNNNTKALVLLLIYRSHLQSANTTLFDEFIELIEKNSINVLTIAVSSLKDAECISTINLLIEQTQPILILNATSFSSNIVGTPALSSQFHYFKSVFINKLPVLQLLLSSSTEQDWLDTQKGLRSRDLAMQVVLPEMDGRIIGHVIGFKCENYFDQRCQINVVRFQLHHQRAGMLVQLAYKYCQLKLKNNHEKRIALILANYPTRDGRIGNGVGLDTPASTMTILKALQQHGYAIDDIPSTSDALMTLLLASLTNNLSTVAHAHCWQSMSLADYQRCFNTLPITSQQAVLERWGQPEHDPKCRHSRLMIAGIRLGQTFIGVGPARGFNMDLNANYHDPDLVPPHSYLAFYFWLRENYNVDAIIHVGKHGNVEWLPGKSTALSETCWPDICMGVLPHFYPFIVNDPGEGAQAKRRTHAVIIDHLMPPMTQAQTYAELAELEDLVDEYYQALNLHEPRQQFLQKEILDKVRSSHLLEELMLESTADTQTLLTELDTYLCDIKNAQIRGGLHILGQLPDKLKLLDTLVALVRLPRGHSPIDNGILHTLCDDLHLLNSDGTQFNPLLASSSDWQGKRPAVLANIDTHLWRSEVDTRERLEILASRWMQRYVIEGQSVDELIASYPLSADQFHFCQNQLLPVLEESAELEIDSLISALNAQGVPPGPSGAPTRGRLDTLPTGRNFYSVDNRAIPSKAAWHLGQLSAQAVLERHLQEHGNYPKQIGLSVWGTATMRTGGDDIAQAFALMGVKPLWVKGCARVHDIEVVPAMLLGRPRVDVVLRVSGFFRDAFPNVIKMFDTAVQAIASYDEPGNTNTIADNIEQRHSQLVEQGLEPTAAYRQASYRVFGSKPGAYGAGLQGLIDERCWTDRADLAQAYLNWGGYAYGNEADDGVSAHSEFQQRLSQIDVVIHNQDNREHDILDSDDYYQFQGGMSNAVTTYSSKIPIIYHGDHSNPSAPTIRTLQQEFNRVVRSRVLNPKWINAMQQHGYKGAFEMAATVDYLFAYDATTDIVADYHYEKVCDALVLNADNQQFLRNSNINAFEEMTERLMESIQRGLWQNPGEYTAALQSLLLEFDDSNETKPNS